MLKFKPVSVLRRLMYILVVVVIFVYVAGNSQNPDIFASKYHYEKAMFTNEAWLLNLLQRGMIGANLNFICHRITLYCIGFMFLHLGVKKCLGANNAFWLLYAIFPMMIDATQTENFVAMAIVFYALVSSKDTSIRGKIRVIFWLVIAMGFHLAVLAYVPFVFLPSLSEKRFLVRNLSVMLTAAIIATVFREHLVFAFGELLSFVFSSDGRIELYFSNVGGFGFFVFWSFHLLLLWVACNARNIAIKNETEGRISDLAVRILVYSLLFFPLYAIDSNFFRLTRNLIPFVIISVLQKTEETQRLRRKCNIFFLVIILLLWFLFQIVFSNFDSILIPFFRNNYFFEII